MSDLIKVYKIDSYFDGRVFVGVYECREAPETYIVEKVITGYGNARHLRKNDQDVFSDGRKALTEAIRRNEAQVRKWQKLIEQASQDVAEWRQLLETAGHEKHL